MGLKASGTYDAVAISATSYTRVASYQVTPQTQHRFGYGAEGRQQANIGILTFLPKTSAAGGTLIPGIVRLSVVDSEDRPRDIVIHSVRVERLSKDLTDGKEVVFFLAEQGVKARPYDKLIIEMLADTAANISGSASSLRMDTTIYL
jgi:hypothetical protein